MAQREMREEIGEERRERGRRGRGSGQTMKDEHYRTQENCAEEIDWSSPMVITTMSNKSKKKLTYDLKIREALEIRKRNCGPGHGLNEDYGAYVKTTMWNPVFHQMDNG